MFKYKNKLNNDVRMSQKSGEDQHRVNIKKYYILVNETYCNLDISLISLNVTKTPI